MGKNIEFFPNLCPWGVTFVTEIAPGAEVLNKNLVAQGLAQDDDNQSDWYMLNFSIWGLVIKKLGRLLILVNWRRCDIFILFSATTEAYILKILQGF